MDASAIGPLVGTGKVAEIFAYGDHVLKLYRDPAAKAAAFREAAILAIVEATGLPIPTVLEVGELRGRWGLVMSRAVGDSFAASMLAHPERAGDRLAVLATLQRRVNAAPGLGLISLKARLAANLSRAPRLDPALRAGLLARLAALPDGDRLCHGDFHPYNVLGTPDAPVIVDWLDATAGPPEADLCRSYLLLTHVAPALADVYITAAAPDPASRAGTLAWLPILAAARLAENVPEEEERLLHLAEG